MDKTMTFIILALPRSRTAWMSAFMSACGAFCYHEGLNGCYSVDEYVRKVQGKGDSSTGTMLLDVQSIFPKAKKLIIESDHERALQWGYETYGAYMPDYIKYLQRRLDKIPGERVRVEDIDKELGNIWTHLTGRPFDAERAELFKGLNIQVQDPHNYDHEAIKALLNDPQFSKAGFNGERGAVAPSAALQ